AWTMARMPRQATPASDTETAPSAEITASAPLTGDPLCRHRHLLAGDDGRWLPSAVNAPGRPLARLPAQGVRAARNQRSASAGMGVRLAPESGVGLAPRTAVVGARAHERG